MFVFSYISLGQVSPSWIASGLLLGLGPNNDLNTNNVQLDHLLTLKCCCYCCKSSFEEYLMQLLLPSVVSKIVREIICPVVWLGELSTQLLGGVWRPHT